MAGYRDLEVWKQGISLVEQVYRATASFPQCEQYGLTSQARRAAVSVPANIAEGRGRASTKEFVRFVGISLGSLAELETHLMIAERLGFLEKQHMNNLLKECESIARMLSATRRTLQSKLKQQSPDPPKT